MAIEGSCLCGAVKITVNESHETQILCHCTDCSHSSGSAFSTNILAEDKNTTFTGPITKYTSKAPSGNDVSRTFCSVCGSWLSHKSVAFGESSAIQTGNLRSYFKDVKVGAELFTKDRWPVFAAIEGAGQKNTM